MNPISFHSVSSFRLHDDDDETDIESMRTRIRYRMNTRS